MIGGIAKAVLVVGLIGGALAGLGVASMALSFVLGLVASGIAFVFGAIATLFSPLGVLIGLFAAAGVAAIVYRDAIAETFRGLLVGSTGDRCVLSNHGCCR